MCSDSVLFSYDVAAQRDLFLNIYFSLLQAVSLSCQSHKCWSNLFFVFFYHLCCCFSSLFLASLRTTTLCQRERQGCVAVWLAAVSGACQSWPTYQWRPRICGRFHVNPSSWLRNWATASLEKCGWVGTVRLCCRGRGGRHTMQHTWIPNQVLEQA